MSLQKVVSNYYIDLLDYLGNKYRKHNGNFDVYFDSMSADGQKQLIEKIASVFQRIHILRSTQRRFWRTRARNQTAYVIILSLMIVLSFFVMIWNLLTSLRSGELVTSFQKKSVIVMYIIIYLVIFTVFLLIIVNIQENKKQSRALHDETTTDLDSLQSLFGASTELIVVMRFIGFKSTETKREYNLILKENEAVIKRIMGKDFVTAEVVGQKNTQGKPKKFKINEADSVNYKSVFMIYRNELLTCIKNFYDNGEGYVTMRKEVVASSNILILKEFRRIMEYYYKLMKRKNNSELLKDDKKVNDILDKYVVTEINLVGKLLVPMNENAFVDVPAEEAISRLDELQKSINMNFEDEDFVKAYNDLTTFMVYIVFYCLQLYFKKSANDKTFDPILKKLMPQYIDTTLFPESVELMSNIKKTFVEHEKTKLNALIVSSTATNASMSTLYFELLQQFQQALDPYYQNVMIHLKGDFFFPFSPWYYETIVLSLYEGYKDALKQAKIEDTFYKEFMSVYGKRFIPSYWTTFKEKFKDINLRKDALISRISANIAKYDKLKVMEHQAYVQSKVQKTPETEAVIMEILVSVDQQVANKKLSEDASYGKKANSNRFLELEQFVEEVDKVTYVDLKVGLNLEFYSEILDRFYYSVNNSIYSSGNNGNRTSKDIYFASNKNFKLAKIALIFGIVIICLALVYNIMSVNEDYKYANVAESRAIIQAREKEEKEKIRGEVKYLTRSFTEHKLNIWMKGVIPIAFGIFFICLLISVYKKHQTKFRYNKETIDSNTSELRSALGDLRIMFEDFDIKIPLAQRNQMIKNLTILGPEEKANMYEKLKIVIDKFEKCNYVLATQKSELPFPYTEVIIDAFMIAVIVLCIFWVLGQIGPFERFKKIRNLNRLKEKGVYSNTTKEWNQDALVEASCHDSEMDSILFMLKILFFLFIVLFLIFYATKVLTSTSEFELGIYNSMYFEESMCID